MDVVNVGDQYFTVEDKSLRFTIYQDPPDYYENNGRPVHTGPKQNITSWQVSWMAKRRKSNVDGNAKILKFVGTGITITDGVNGVLVVDLDDADIDDIVAGQLYYHELKRIDGNFQTVLAQGTFMLNQALHQLT